MIFSREFVAALVARRPSTPNGPDPVDRTVDAHRRIDSIQRDVHELRRRLDAIPAATVPDRAITRTEAAMLPTGTLIEAQVSCSACRMTLMAVGSTPGAFVDAPTGTWHTADELDVRAGIAVLWTPGGAA